MSVIPSRLGGCAVVMAAFLVQCSYAIAGDPPELSVSKPLSPPLEVTLQPSGEGRFALGKVVLDKERRQVSFPAVVNQREGLVEYVVVTTQGKTHESVLRTDAEPKHIHLAMLLLGIKPANTNFQPPDFFFRPPPGDKVTLDAIWRQGGSEVRCPLESLVITTNNMRGLVSGPWVYNGSFLQGGTFIAQRDGSIVALKVDGGALINNPRSGRENENLYCVNTSALPPEGVTVEITIVLPASNSAPAIAPTNSPAAAPDRPASPSDPIHTP